MLKLVTATTSYVHDIHAMVRELAVYEKLEHQVVSTPEDFARELFGADARVECVMALWNETAVGFALYFHNFSTFQGRKGLYLEDLYVKPDYRGHGIGKALLIELARIAQARGCGRYEWSVLDWNTPSIQFYEAMGATVLTDWQRVRLEGEGIKQLAARDEARS